MTNAADYDVIWSTSRKSQMLDFLTCPHTTDALKVNMSLSPDFSPGLEPFFIWKVTR